MAATFLVHDESGGQGQNLRYPVVAGSVEGVHSGFVIHGYRCGFSLVLAPRFQSTAYIVY